LINALVRVGRRFGYLSVFPRRTEYGIVSTSSFMTESLRLDVAIPETGLQKSSVLFEPITPDV